MGEFHSLCWSPPTYCGNLKNRSKQTWLRDFPNSYEELVSSSHKDTGPLGKSRPTEQTSLCFTSEKGSSVEQSCQGSTINCSTSSWTLPLILVGKNLRRPFVSSTAFCVDHRNWTLTLKDFYALLQIYHTLGAVAIAVWFAVLDFKLCFGRT